MSPCTTSALASFSYLYIAPFSLLVLVELINIEKWTRVGHGTIIFKTVDGYSGSSLTYLHALSHHSLQSPLFLPEMVMKQSRMD